MKLTINAVNGHVVEATLDALIWVWAGEIVGASRALNLTVRVAAVAEVSSAVVAALTLIEDAVAAARVIVRRGDCVSGSGGLRDGAGERTEGGDQGKVLQHI